MKKLSAICSIPSGRAALAAVLSVLLLAGLVASVSAQEGEGGGGGGSATTYDFEDDLVQGDLVRPDGENLMVRRRGARESLIKIREHFVPELLKSVENL
ncbi:MAG TPA: hypothetical protein VJV78_21090 [Polyangiales bacterium]|nr:hypothetical protein [Polyangiales bacterium]